MDEKFAEGGIFKPNLCGGPEGLQEQVLIEEQMKKFFPGPPSELKITVTLDGKAIMDRVIENLPEFLRRKDANS